MIDLRPFGSLGHADHGWLDARHHFSFAGYHDPERMGWGAIRVWNDDTIAPQTGFPPHAHADMEIVTYVRDGAITHEDSLGNRGRTEAGSVQVMSAGAGIRHAEYNREAIATRIFQIWIMPDRPGGEPQWGQRSFPMAERRGAFDPIASGSGSGDTVLAIRADATVSAAALRAGQRARYETRPDRHLYMVATRGTVRVNGVEANARDGVAITGEAAIDVEAVEDVDIVLVDSR